VIRKLYGPQKAYHALGIYIDRPAEFEKAVHQRLAKNTPETV